ncbi:MAG: septum site-determining protein MinD [Clostridiales bacterium]|nr:septum site-determining protein MinD [Clostridiales bacterium]
MARVIVLTSGKGGVGKTTVTANLGMHLASKNYRVCLVDMDIGLNNLDVVMNLEDRVLYTMIDVIDGRCRLKEALIQDDYFPLLYVLSSGGLNQDLTIHISQIKNIISSLHDSFDYVLIDCPAGIDAGFRRAVSCADEAIVVTTPHLSSIRDADKVVTILSSYNISSKRFVINRARGDLIQDKVMFDVYDIGKTLGIDFGGVIPEDDKVIINTSDNIKNNKIASNRAFEILANNIITGEKKLFDCTYKYRGILGSIKKLLKRSV